MQKRELRNKLVNASHWLIDRDIGAPTPCTGASLCELILWSMVVAGWFDGQEGGMTSGVRFRRGQHLWFVSRYTNDFEYKGTEATIGEAAFRVVEQICKLLGRDDDETTK